MVANAGKARKWTEHNGWCTLFHTPATYALFSQEEDSGPFEEKMAFFSPYTHHPNEA